MSIHSHFDNPKPVGPLPTAPIVLRFASIFPRDLKRREMHDKRTGGDLTHIRTDLSSLNSQPVGGVDWIERLHAEIEAAIENNFEEEIAARERKGRFLEVERLRERGPVDPWKYTREGPLREGVLTVNKLWLGGTGHENWDPDRSEAFKQRATAFLLEHFPDGQLREADIDEDEEALHFHFAVAVWVEKVSQNRGRQWLLQPSANPLLANYEYAQDVAGAAFLDLGIHRGERRAAAARQALAAGLEAPEPRQHVPPSQWRREQRRLALEDRDRIREKTRAEAEATVAGGVALAKAAVKKSRQRSIAEAKDRKAETDRQVATVERDRTCAEAQAETARAAQAKAEAARIEADRQAFEAREKAALTTQAAENRAGVIVADVTALATVTVRKSRKRAVAEAQARRAEADRAAAAAGRDRATEEARAERVRQAQARAQAERIAAEVAAVAARAEAARVEQAAEAEADRIRTDAAAVADGEQARADAAREARDAAEAARLAADKAAAEATRKAEAAQATAARAMARADAMTSGLVALTQEMTAGTLRLRNEGGVIARAPDLLSPAFPEIKPAVQAAAAVAEEIRAARREANDVTRATEEERKAAKAEIVRDRAAATAAIAKERETAVELLEKQHKAVTAELDAKREHQAGIERELEDKVSAVTALVSRLQLLLVRVVRWLSRPELPASMKEEGMDLVAEGLALSRVVTPDDPSP